MSEIKVGFSKERSKALDRIDCAVLIKGLAKLDILCFNSVLSMRSFERVTNGSCEKITSQTGNATFVRMVFENSL